ncbi:MAG: hypothetical protein WBA74_06955, partial [Cyclobacteriaceae bacterium]
MLYINDHINKYIKHLEAELTAKSSIKNIRSTLLEFEDEILLHDIKTYREAVDHYLYFLSKKMETKEYTSTRTINTKRYRLKRYLSYLIEEGIEIDVNLDKLNGLKTGQKEATVIKLEDVTKIVEYLKGKQRIIKR